MKKTFFFMSLLLGLLVSSFALTACGDDDDKENTSSNSLVGTWTVTSSDDRDLEANSFTFYADGSMTFPNMKSGYYMRYTYNGNSLRIDMGNGKPDDSLIGTVVITGNSATYTYHWADYYGKWESDDVYTMKLTKQ